MTAEFEKKCLHCGEVLQSSSYNCDCSNEQWQDEYRSLDFRLQFEEEERQNIAQSFYDYSLDDQRGMLQYKALPNHNFLDDGLLTVGNTPLFRLEHLSKKWKTQIFIKSEGHNPSGCFKDRETLMCLLNSRSKGLNKAVIYSSGNAAASAAIFAQRNKLHLITFVSGDTYEEKIDFIRSHGSDVIVIGDSETNFEQGYRLFSRINAMGFYADLDYDNWSVRNPHRVEGDKTTAVEIIRQLGMDGQEPIVPDFVIIPTANGSCMAGMWKGFKELYELGVISRLPKMISAGITNANPVYKAVKTGNLTTPSVCDLSKLTGEDSDIGSIICAEEGYDSIQAARAVIESGGTAVEVGKTDIEETLRLLLQEETRLAVRENILPEPASLISVAAVAKMRKEVGIKPEHRVVSVITGSGVKSVSKIKELMPEDSRSTRIVESILAKKKREQYPAALQQGRRRNVPPDIEAIINAFNELKK